MVGETVIERMITNSDAPIVTDRRKDWLYPPLRRTPEFKCRHVMQLVLSLLHGRMHL